MIILGIDPGTRFTGFGLIKKELGEIRHVDNGIVAPSPSVTLPKKLKKIFDKLEDLIREYSPGEIALEDLFVAKNAKSTLKLGYVRGVVMLAAAAHDIPLYEYPPSQIKLSISGFGGATKEQMQKMVQIHLKLKERAEENASDALAVALCHCQTRRFEK